MIKIGGHVSAAQHISLVFERAAKIGADCCQFFISPPQQWSQTEHSDEEIELFVKKQAQSNIGPNYIHGTYLINLGASNPEHLQKSIDWLIYAQKTASKLKVTGVIFHLGSHKNAGFESVEKQVCQSIKKVMDSSNDSTQLILETSAGAGGNIGGTFQELGILLKKVNDPRLKVCLDTAHVFAAGHDLRTTKGVQLMLDEFDQQIGLRNLVVVHANDSKFDLQSNKDRHENIGQGFIGKKGFECLFKAKALRDLAFILEVPGFENLGPDQKNINILKSLAKIANS